MEILHVIYFLTLLSLGSCILDPCYFYQDDTTFDLTHPFYEGIPAYPGLDPQAFDLNLAYEYGDPHFFLSYNYSVSGLAGTSMTSPAVFFPFNRQISEIPFSQLVRLIGRVIDISDQVKLNPNYEATVDDIVCNENEYGCFAPGTVVIFYTGWASRWPNQERVFGLEGLLGLDLLPIDYNYPGISEEAARYIASQPNVYGVMIDSPGVDSGAVPIIGFDIYKSSRILARENKYIVQNVNLECTLPNINLKIYILPLYVLGGTSAPCRIFAHVCQDQCPVPALPPAPPPPPPPPHKSFDNSGYVDPDDYFRVRPRVSSPTRIEHPNLPPLNLHRTFRRESDSAPIV
uniref:Uncharacterized protein n=1 Tax=Graphocephala atropunctata TaxID=36148 RepID=A0A1B6LN79_9HEMI